MTREPDWPLELPKRKKRRKGRVLPAPQRSARVYVYIAPDKVHLFRYLLEAEDNLGTMTVVDRWRAALALRYSPHQEQAVRLFLESVGETLEISTVALGAYSKEKQPPRQDCK
ncbi:DUF4911 domain-containing protein [Desulfovibrio sp. OttesenSCG-928-M16]|nr:DUF4911 domain-containing protein [Desulfovibrio sp. OttesenSCG-928-M16]